MTNGFAWVIGEFALTNSKGNVIRQRTVTGYSTIESMNTNTQRELLYENAVNHARSKFLYDAHKNSDTETNWYITDYGFKRVSKIDGQYVKPKDSKRKLTKKQRNRAEDRVNIKTIEKREDKTKMVKEKDKNKMYAKKHELSPSQKRDLDKYKDYLLFKKMQKDKGYQNYLKSKK